jgi:anion transporter
VPRRLAIAAAMTAAASLLLLPGLGLGPQWLDPAQSRAAGLTLFTLSAWALVVFPEFFTALCFYLIAMLAQVAPASVVFSGFSSIAFWLIVGGLVVGIAIERTGLGRRLARALFGRLGASYTQAVAAVAAAAVALAFLMPSTMGRVLLLLPIVLALCDRLGLKEGGRGRTGLVMTAALATYIPSCGILPANVPNTVMIGAVEQLYGVKLTYASYLVWIFPAIGVGYTALLVPVVARLCRETPKPPREGEAHAPLSRDERVLTWILCIALLAYATDFLHGISPAWVSLAAGIACLAPGLGVVPARTFSERMSLAILIYIAAIIGIGAVMADSGLGARLSRLLIEWARLEPGATLHNVTAIFALSVLVGVAATVIAQPAVLVPLAGDIAQAAGLPLMTVLMIYVTGFAVILFPYQSGPLVVAMQLGGVSARQGVRLTLIMGGATILVLAPLAFLWWRVLGLTG